MFVDVEESGELERAGLNWAWDRVFTGDQVDFTRALAKIARPVVLAWGFPPACLGTVAELIAAGMTAWWLDGDRDAARQAFIARASGSIDDFDTQMRRIREQWSSISQIFAGHMIRTVHPGGTYSSPDRVFRLIVEQDA